MLQMIQLISVSSRRVKLPVSPSKRKETDADHWKASPVNSPVAESGWFLSQLYTQELTGEKRRDRKVEGALPSANARSVRQRWTGLPGFDDLSLVSATGRGRDSRELYE